MLGKKDLMEEDGKKNDVRESSYWCRWSYKFHSEIARKNQACVQALESIVFTGTFAGVPFTGFTDIAELENCLNGGYDFECET
jgi:hypothetical protein